MAITISTPTIGGNEGSWGSVLNTQLTAIESTFNGSGTGKATVAPDLSTLTINGTNVTATAAELNIMDGVTATTAELNKIDGFTGVVADLNYAKDLRATGVTATEFDFLDGVTSNIQTQLDAKGVGSMSNFRLQDGDGNGVVIDNAEYIKFVEGTGLDIDWTDTTTGSSTDPYDMTFSLLPDQRFAAATDVYVGNSHEHIHFNDGSQHIEFMTGGVEEMRLENDGDLHVDGNITAYSTTVSDQRLKHDIQKIDGALDKLSQLSGYTFSYNKDGKKSAGVIAQEVEKVLPSAVENKSLVFHGQEGIEYKTVQYDQLHGLLIEAIKELKAEIEVLKNGSTK